MRVSDNRIKISKSMIYEVVNSIPGNKVDLTMVESRNYIPIEKFQEELNEMKLGKYDLIDKIIDALKTNKIIVSHTDSKASAMVYTYTTDNSGNIKIVFINADRFIKESSTYDTKKDKMVSTYKLTGGRDKLYQILLGAYISLHTKEVMTSQEIANKVKDFYVDTLSSIITNNFGNTMDGEQFRFITSFFFYNGTLDIDSLFKIEKFPRERLIILKNNYKDFFSKKEVDLPDLIKVLVTEYGDYFRTEITPRTLVEASFGGLGDTGLFILDNIPYLLATIIVASKKSDIFKGYMLRSTNKVNQYIFPKILKILS